MEREEFEKVVVEAFEGLPEWVKRKVQNVALMVLDEPSEDVRREQGLSDDETLLGLYTGVPATERGIDYGIGPTLPDTVFIYRIPILEGAGNDPERIKAVVRDTVYHEFAHHFGMTEDEVGERERRGWEQGNEKD